MKSILCLVAIAATLTTAGAQAAPLIRIDLKVSSDDVDLGPLRMLLSPEQRGALDDGERLRVEATASPRGDDLDLRLVLQTRQEGSWVAVASPRVMARRDQDWSLAWQADGQVWRIEGRAGAVGLD